jgi:group I intron endonuclease
VSYGIIYKAVGPTGKVYVGQTVESLKIRKGKHKYSSIKGDKRSPFQAALLEHGFDSFVWEQIDQAETKEELDQKEKEWIEKYNSTDPAFGYNDQSGGIHFEASEESKIKSSISNTGQKRSMETKENIRLSKIGNHCRATLSEDIVRNIKTDYAKGLRPVDVMRKYSIPPSIAYPLKYGKTYQWVSI